MNARDWLGATWPEIAPSWGRGHFEVWNLIVMSRAELGRIAREQHDDGALAERHDPGRRLFRESDPGPQLAEAHPRTDGTRSWFETVTRRIPMTFRSERAITDGQVAAFNLGLTAGNLGVRPPVRPRHLKAIQ